MPKHRSKRSKRKLLEQLVHQQRWARLAGAEKNRTTDVLKTAAVEWSATNGDDQLDRSLQYSPNSSYDSDSSSSNQSVTLEVCDISRDGENASSSHKKDKIADCLTTWVRAERSVPVNAVRSLLHALQPLLPALPPSAEAMIGEATRMPNEDPNNRDLTLSAGQQVLINRINELEHKFESLKSFVQATMGEERIIKVKNSVSRASNNEELKKVAEQVKEDPESCGRLVEQETLRSTVRAFIKLTMERDLAAGYSWSGMGKDRKRTKQSFKDSELFVALTDMLQGTKHKGANVFEIADCIKKVLSGAADWDGGRNRRQSYIKPDVGVMNGDDDS